MDEIFCGVDGKLRMVSITDSTMMRMVHSAMNKAHESVKSKEGVIERLNETSKFYEFAVMQLQGCIKFIQDESSHEEEVLAGLLEIRDRLLGRLNESELAITDKDRELVERTESEARLRRELEMKERELSSMKAKLERTRNIDEGRDGEFCELKNSVDQQVWNIRQRLEPDYDDQGDEIGDEKVEQMGVDIDALKETLDVAFNKMRTATAPMEHQWKWGVERDTLCVLIRGLVRDFQEKFEGKDWVSSRERNFPVWFDGFLRGFVDEVEGLKSELGTLFCDDVEIVQETPKTNSEEVGSDESENYVTKMIKNHEFFIRKKSVEAEKLSLLRREVMREKAHLFSKRENEPVSLKKRAHSVMMKLDSLIEWKNKLCEPLGDHSHMISDEIVFDSTEAKESMKEISRAFVEESRDKISWLEQELQDSNLETRITEEIYVVLYEGVLEEFNFRSCRCSDTLIEMKTQWDEDIGNNLVESKIRDEIRSLVFNEAIKDFKSAYNLEVTKINKKLDDTEKIVRSEITEKLNTEILVREEISHIVYAEAIKTIVETASSALCQCEEAKLVELDKYNVSPIGEEIFQLVSLEAGKDTCSSSKYTDEKLQRFEQLGTEESSAIENPIVNYNQENQSKLLNQSGSMLSSVQEFFQVMANFEHNVREKLELNSLRLEKICKGDLNPLVKAVSLLREQESLYRKAFTRRCQNLHKAEIEVDLLGDQVERLLNLLQKIYSSLDNYSLYLQKNVWVSDLMHMIKKELNGIHAHTFA